MREWLRAKVHRAQVTATELAYEGSVTIGRNLLEAADIAPYERVLVANVANGERLETYAIEGAPGEVHLNGAAARGAAVGDEVILLTFARGEAPDPRIVHVDDDNEVTGIDRPD